MTRQMIAIAVTLTAYCLLDWLLSAAAVLLWRTRGVAPLNLPPAVRARRLFAFRLAPATLACLTTLAIVLPAFALFEPSSEHEPVGPLVVVLALAGASQLLAALISASRSAWLTRRLRREWTAGAVIMPAQAGVSLSIIETPAPIVALVGIANPVLVAARSVVAACTPKELQGIVAHERAHLAARDNVKRWLMSSAPGVLRWSALHTEMLDAWHHAAEDAADDAATGEHPVARAELAALLLKVVRLAPAPLQRHAIVSPFVEDDHGLERRVRRLLSAEREAPAPLAIAPLASVGVMTAAVIGVLASPGALQAVFGVVEALVAIGR